ncbi:flagellin, partial [Opitutales bacterium]|nr:flagellin [Opitutales bacterium]
MPLTINSNSAASSASFYMSKNNSALQKSINRLSSGSKIVHPNDDAGGLAVSMKLESMVTRLNGADKNIQNAVSFLEVQDGVLASTGKIVSRMIELKGLSQDVMKNSSDNDNYNREFKNLQVQLYDMSNLTFNGVSMFANFTSEGTAAVFDDMEQKLNEDNTMSIYVSSEGNIGPKVSINKSLLLSALTIDATDMTSSTWIATENTNNDDAWSFASQTYAVAISLGAISVGVFTQALENIATLRADNGGTMSRLEFASDNVT